MRTLWLHGMGDRPMEWEHQIFLKNRIEPHALNLNYSLCSAFEILYEYIPKQVESGLTPLEKLAIAGRKKQKPISIPQRTIVR